MKWLPKSTGVNLMESSSFGHPPEPAAPEIAGLSINLTVGTAAPTLCKKVLRVQSRLNPMCRLLKSTILDASCHENPAIVGPALAPAFLRWRRNLTGRGPRPGKRARPYNFMHIGER